MARFIEALHPRDKNGRFKGKGSAGVRVSTRSVSVNAGRRYAVVPGKVNVYVGGLIRVENASRSKGPIDRFIDRKSEKLLSLIPDGGARRVAQGLAGTGQFRSGSTLVQGTLGRRSTPTIRATKNSGSLARNSARTGDTIKMSGTKKRAPRKPRQPRRRVITA
jgi:hypothetical protein